MPETLDWTASGEARPSSERGADLLIAGERVAHRRFNDRDCPGSADRSERHDYGTRHSRDPGSDERNGQASDTVGERNGRGSDGLSSCSQL